MSDVGELHGVPETLLWTLWHRALEARKPNGVLHDPWAVELVDTIDYPFEEQFGESRWQAQWQGLRTLRFDVEVRRFLAANPGGTVVALGEGLETQFWRVDDGRMRWLSVDLPETIAVQERLLPRDPRRKMVARSALDPGWLDAVDTVRGGWREHDAAASRGVLVTAAGLLMYLPRDDVHRLIEICAAHLPGQAMLFDAMPRWLVKATGGDVGGDHVWKPPPWRWWVDAPERRALAALPGVAELCALRPLTGRGLLLGHVLPTLAAIPGLRDTAPAFIALRFAGR